MSIKDLFNRSSQVVVSSSLEKIAEDAESPEYIIEYNEDVVRVEPHIDFSDPANFSKYGSAEEYYLRSLEYIYDEYPYDGSLKERLQWKKDATLLDLYVLDNKYPTLPIIDLPGSKTIFELFFFKNDFINMLYFE